MTRELALKPSRFRARRSGASIGSVGGAKVGYRLSEAARVKFIVELATTGRKTRGKCVRATRSNRRKRRCTRWVAVRGSFTHAGSAGRNSFRFTGRLRGKRLKPGTYRLVGVGVDSARNKGRAVKVSFKILR